MPRGGRTSFFIELIDLGAILSIKAHSGGSMTRDLLLDRRPFPGKFHRNLWWGIETTGPGLSGSEWKRLRRRSDDQENVSRGDGGRYGRGADGQCSRRLQHGLQAQL